MPEHTQRRTITSIMTTCCHVDNNRPILIFGDMRHTSPSLSEPERRPAHALTSLVIEVFRLNGALLAAGDALVHHLGLTSARWQVLGAIALSPVTLPVAHIARNMGLTRQAVQRVVDDLRADGLVQLEPNPHHRRAMLVTMTEAGNVAYRQASELQQRWANDLASDLSAEAIETAAGLLRTLQQRLDRPAEPLRQST